MEREWLRRRSALYRVLDLFAGAGGLSLGFEQTGKFHVAVAVEKNLYAQQTYKKNHEHTTILEDILDITDYNSFQQQYGRFDVVMGGPPCQGFSNANRQKNHVLSKNNFLVKKYVEIIVNLRPAAFVMENVRMLKSEIHRFFQTSKEKTEIERLGISVRKELVTLYSGQCPVDDLDEYLAYPELLESVILPEKDYDSLRRFLKHLSNEESRSKILEKKGKQCKKIIDSILSSRQLSIEKENVSFSQKTNIGSIVSNHHATAFVSYLQFEKEALQAFAAYIEGRSAFEEAELKMKIFISLQRLFFSIQELYHNDIIIDRLTIDETGIKVEVQSFSVVEYINKKLGQYYFIDAGILNAAWFGVPQLRERYIAIGIRRDIAQKHNIQPQLPEAYYTPEEYRTVADAIKDIEKHAPSYNINATEIDISDDSFEETPLTRDLRNSDKLYNHITTETRETALKRFAALKPGQNFHDLDLELIQDTYSQPARTQNSIYLRLEYDKPSGTVTNVRKSMWIHPALNRAVSIREAARLQTFPDGFVFCGSKDSQYQQIGNAVPPLMAKAIATKLAELLDLCGVLDSQRETISDGYIYSGATPSSDVKDSLQEYNTRVDCKEISA